MAHFVVESHVKRRVHELGKQISAEGIDALVGSRTPTPHHQQQEEGAGGHFALTS